ncbi:hypothetical protein NL108_013829 [Boleophthalmus pectinirostris]|nr:hypothetical protein NL108_013829 [Boleophthalmus pectinirostris]
MWIVAFAVQSPTPNSPRSSPVQSRPVQTSPDGRGGIVRPAPKHKLNRIQGSLLKTAIPRRGTRERYNSVRYGERAWDQHCGDLLDRTHFNMKPSPRRGAVRGGAVAAQGSDSL